MPIHLLSPIFTFAFVVYFIWYHNLEKNRNTMLPDAIAVQVGLWLLAILIMAFTSSCYGSTKGPSVIATCVNVGWRFLLELKIGAGIALTTLVVYAVILEKRRKIL